MGAAEVQHYLGRARDLFGGMKHLLNDDLVQYRYSPALLGIHGAISYCDALRIGLGSGKLSSEDHQSAIGDLKSLLAKRKFDKRQGADKLEKLLGRKSRIAYGADETRVDEVKVIVQLAERFAVWAETTGKELKIEGW